MITTLAHGIDSARALIHAPAFSGMRNAGQGALGFFVPELCPLCNGITGGRGVCPRCWQGLKLATPLACKRCASPFEHDGILPDTCLNCRIKPPAFHAAAAALVYNDAARVLILGLKHGDRLDIAPTLARLMLPAARPLIESADMVIPLPLHRRRFFARRFNQSAEIARHLLGIYSRDIGENMEAAEFRPDILLRTRNTPSQGSMKKKARQRNMRGAFGIAPGMASAVKGKRILLIDDVLTTGASLDAAARCLVRAGAEHIAIAVVARVNLDG